jgi:hypothetical protein
MAAAFGLIITAGSTLYIFQQFVSVRGSCHMIYDSLKIELGEIIVRGMPISFISEYEMMYETKMLQITTWATHS